MKKFICTGLSVASFIYTIWYMHYGVPYKNSGALSKIGLQHPFEFTVWGVLTFTALAVNIVIAYKKHTKTRAYIPLLIVAGIGMIMTLCFDFDYDIKPDYYLHCGGSLTFSVIMGITIFILFLLNFKKEKLFRAFTYITAIILLTDMVCLFIFKETGLIEALPIFAGYIMLGAINTRRDKIEAYERA